MYVEIPKNLKEEQSPPAGTLIKIGSKRHPHASIAFLGRHPHLCMHF